MSDRITDGQIRSWADKHDIQGLLTDLRCMFEDARTTEPERSSHSGSVEALTEKWGRRLRWYAHEPARKGQAVSILTDCINDLKQLQSVPPVEAWRDKIADFVNLILHGDDEHKTWLREAGEAFMFDRPIPTTRQKQFCCAVCKRGANEAGQLFRVSKKGDIKPVIWICQDHFNYEDWKFVEDNDERLQRRVERKT